jgi:CheY-like chemotaxis protein
MEILFPINILIADDDKDDRAFFEQALKELPIKFRLNTVTNGEELMLFLRSHETELPDVLFLDISMPRKTGIECLVEIKNDLKLKHMPVIIFTTSYTRGLEMELELSSTLSRMGAVDYVRKPPEFSDLKKAIQASIVKALKPSRVKDF